MTTPHPCGKCGQPIETCPNCGGKVCTVGCPDRMPRERDGKMEDGDGCTCG